MIKLIDGEALPPATAGPSDTLPDLGRLAPVLLVIAVVIGGALRAALGRLPGAVLAAGLVGLIIWFLSGVIVIALFGAMIGFMGTLFGGVTGRYGGWYGGGGGGFGGGGFRGGGGGFGGGGASGRW